MEKKEMNNSGNCDRETENKQEKEKQAKPATDGETVENANGQEGQEEQERQQQCCEQPVEDVNSIKALLDEKTRQCEEYFGMLQRTAAEFDNYKKRTAREKEALYADAVCDIVSAFLPVIDSVERAMQACMGEDASSALKEGFELVYRQFKDVVKNLGVCEIKSVGEKFDPSLHNAVMHVEDESAGEGIIVEEFQKGYMLNDRVIRHSMVKVAN